MVRDGLVGHPGHDEDDQCHDQQGGAHHHDGDHPVGRHLALDHLGRAEPGEGQEAEYQQTRKPKAPVSEVSW